MPDRYKFDATRMYFWRDLLKDPNYLFGMWSTKRTLKFILKDTLLRN